MSLEAFQFEIPETVGEHAEISSYLLFLEETFYPITRGEKTLVDLDREIAIAKHELECCLKDCLDRYDRTQNKAQ